MWRSMQRGNYDLAIHQLARIVAQHPNYVRAGLLLSLLYIEAGDYKRADHYLRLVRKTDRMNQTAVRYADAAAQELRRVQKRTSRARKCRTGRKPIRTGKCRMMKC